MIRLRERPANWKFTEPIPGDRDGRSIADALLVGNAYSPGTLVIQQAGIIYTWDKQKGYGFSGSSLRFTGEDLCEFSIKWTLWTAKQTDEWDEWYKKCFAKPPTQAQQNGAFLPGAPKPKALAVSHPLLADVCISQIVPEKIMQWDIPTGAEFGNL